MVGSAKAMVFRTRLDEIRQLGRATQGVKVMTKLQDDDRVISLSAFKERSEEALDNTTPRLVSPSRNAQQNGATPKQLAFEVDTPAPVHDAGEDDVWDDDDDVEEEEEQE